MMGGNNYNNNNNNYGNNNNNNFNYANSYGANSFGRANVQVHLFAKKIHFNPSESFLL